MAAMSHELRTPLNSIIGFTDMMLKGLAGEVTVEQQRQLGMVLQSGQQLLALINDVLDLARLDAGHVRVLATEFSVAEAVGNLVDMMAPVAAGQHLELTWRSEEGVTDRITTDRGKFDQIMLNLLSNAVKFTDVGFVELVIRQDGPEAVALEVRDTGIGIAIEDIDLIFDHFQQVGSYTTKSHPGTGLGLPISRRLAEAIGGRIDVTSTVGEGSTFVLTLPISGPPPGDVGRPSASPTR
jgi:signal transduction histidine kinase